MSGFEDQETVSAAFPILTQQVKKTEEHKSANNRVEAMWTSTRRLTLSVRAERRRSAVAVYPCSAHRTWRWQN
jgi:hypothetical protein